MGSFIDWLTSILSLPPGDADAGMTVAGFPVPITISAFLSAVLSFIAFLITWVLKHLADAYLLPRVLRVVRPEAPPSFNERLAGLTHQLESASGNIDAVLKEMLAVSGERERALQRLDAQLSERNAEEAEIKRRIAALKDVKPEAALEFAKDVARLTAAEGRRSAARDYILFGAGVVVSTAMSVLIEWYK